MSPNFAVRWFELDPTYQVMKLFNFIGIIKFSPKAQTPRYPATKEQEAALLEEAPAAE